MNPEDLTTADPEEECYVFAVPEGDLEEDEVLILNIVPPEVGFEILDQEGNA